MKYQITFLLFFTLYLTYAQETENFKYFANQLNPIKTEVFIEKYKNGNVKRKGFITTYKIEGKEYQVYSGEYIKYLKNGNKSYERVMDLFGSPLSSKVFFGGELFSSTKTIELDTNAKTIEEFIYGRSVSIIYEYREYYTDKNNEPVLWKKGIKINDKKSGNWVTYKNKQVVKTKTYKDVDKFKSILKIKYIKQK